MSRLQPSYPSLDLTMAMLFKVAVRRETDDDNDFRIQAVTSLLCGCLWQWSELSALALMSCLIHGQQQAQ